ncbi:hypothetical protein CK203_095389 [Vitis vinifera]|uniref:Uncharacterized protein n=1 Tax=Vitis vinifera TaxID=29760 RepID=A0A438BTV5_VITVI|nr:hypothetical protein CK203_095389 [Vitis vinifera]
MLSGKVPEWLGSSSNLKILNLRSNIFDESIPPELCQLKKIQILDLSNNNMSGTIPGCLNNFTAMTQKGSLVVAYDYEIRLFGLHYWPQPYLDSALIHRKEEKLCTRILLDLPNVLIFQATN